jgi:hypothetical protein
MQNNLIKDFKVKEGEKRINKDKSGRCFANNGLEGG